MIDAASPKLDDQEFLQQKQKAKLKLDSLFPDQSSNPVLYEIPLGSGQSGQKPISKNYPSYPGDLWVIFLLGS
jgi:hypothetical protein